MDISKESNIKRNAISGKIEIWHHHGPYIYSTNLKCDKWQNTPHSKCNTFPNIQLSLASQIYSSSYLDVLNIAFQDDFFLPNSTWKKKSVLMNKCQNVNPNDWHYDLKSDSDVNKRKGLPKKEFEYVSAKWHMDRSRNIFVVFKAFELFLEI